MFYNRIKSLIARCLQLCLITSKSIGRCFNPFVSWSVLSGVCPQIRFNVGFCLFVLLLNVPVKSYGNDGTVSLTKVTTFFLGKLEQAVKQYFMHIHFLVTLSGNNLSLMIQRKRGE